MRTTLDIHDPLVDRARNYAAKKHCSFTSVVEDALRLMLFPSGKRVDARPLQLPTFKGNGLLPGVNLDSTKDLLDRMESH